MFNPFFDPSGLTDKMLMDKINEVSMRISDMRSAGLDYDLIKSQYSLIMSCEEELRTRQAKKQMEQDKKENIVFDTEEYLKSDKEKKHESTRKQNYKPGW